jgi:hypothetical protein
MAVKLKKQDRGMPQIKDMKWKDVMTGRSLLGIVMALLFVSGCSSIPHRIDTEEFAAEFSGRTYSNLLVIGIYEDRTFRISSETSLAEELKTRGIQASPATMFSLIQVPSTQLR